MRSRHRGLVVIPKGMTYKRGGDILSPRRNLHNEVIPLRRLGNKKPYSGTGGKSGLPSSAGGSGSRDLKRRSPGKVFSEERGESLLKDPIAGRSKTRILTDLQGVEIPDMDTVCRDQTEM